ncbi:GNAT family N-acetyltransferase [Roseomonas sp. BN140053]|uniref:GNAT family N-acetyltransferase n=1 Tax=Roseomonas sp. BN140053 TaxID=3391898 RepID=UPI0039EB1F27
MSTELSVRPMQEADLDAADRVFRLAFGTEFGLPDPASFRGDADLLRPRWRTNPPGCFVAEAGGEVVGSVTVMHWGSLAVLGPLSVRPDFWNRGVARLLLPPALAAAEAWGAAVVGLFTNPSSPRHIRLYEEAGFETHHLIAAMSKPVAPGAAAEAPVLFSALEAGAREAALAECRNVAEASFPGLDLGREIRAATEQGVGDTVLLRGDAGRITGFALCHSGPGSESGSEAAVVKFGAVRPGDVAGFGALLRAVDALAAARGAPQVVASVNHARRDAYAAMKAAGFRTVVSGVALRRPGPGGYDRPEVLVTDEWR